VNSIEVASDRNQYGTHKTGIKRGELLPGVVTTVTALVIAVSIIIINISNVFHTQVRNLKNISHL
jgi:hypothetical protein